MTPQEFKAWFEGFTEAVDGVPSKAQWKRIKDRVAGIDGRPITERVYVDRYWPPAYPLYPSYPTRIYSTYTSNSSIPQNAQSFNSVTAMNALGRIEASNMGAA